MIGMQTSTTKPAISAAEPLWYKDAVIYQLHVKTYCDSDGDGIGDFAGLASKLDYLQDLGVTAIWLLPFCPSPLRDDGYDIADYKNIHPAYGSLRDLKNFLTEAHLRGLRVITELVINHTSDQHPWFQRARRAKPGSRWRNWYVWSETPERYPEARIIFKDFEPSNWTWDPVAKAYYWHRFYSHQPDLNFDNPQVQRAILNVLDFWFSMGVDGLRLDAVPYLFEREGTNCENLPETHAFLKQLRAHVDRRFSDRMLLAEANQWPEDAVAYFGNCDECQMAFHFPLMPRLFMALHMEDSFPILDIMDQTPTIPDCCQWAIFLRNHDELTLEMVTDEERDYMYRVYANDPRMRINLGIRRRLFPLLGNHRRRTELMNALLFSMPGTPVIYYGDEIGMGDNIHLGDRDGVRTPMQWSADRNAGFSRANPQELYLPVTISPEYHFEVINVEVQQSNLHSVLWWMKRLIALRKRYKAFGRGSIQFLHPENNRILAFVREYGQERILVVANLSRFVQHVQLDMASYQGMTPIEIFGRTEFPVIGSRAYFLSLGPHSFYWFYLSAPEVAKEPAEIKPTMATLPQIGATAGWETILRGAAREQLEQQLPGYLQKARWFGGKARAIKRCAIRDAFPITKTTPQAEILLIQVEYMAGDPETYVLPISYCDDTGQEKLIRDFPRACIARLKFGAEGKSYLLYDATVDPSFCLQLLTMISRHRRVRANGAELVAAASRGLRELQAPADEPLLPSVMKAEQSNTSVLYGKRFILKLIRRVAPGVNPDLEIGRFLTERGFAHIPPVAGAIEIHRNRTEPITLAILQEFVPNQGDAWKFTLDQLSRYFEHALAKRLPHEDLNRISGSLTELASAELPAQAIELIGGYLQSTRLIGQRTAELHVCLASEAEAPDFRPESFSKLYQRSLYQSMRTLAAKTFPLLRRYADRLPEDTRGLAKEVLNSEKVVMDRFRSITALKITAMRIRCHGDYHLGQVLYTGRDFVIIDFEGEPARPISERKIKRSPVRDVAGMLRSFHYATYSALLAQKERGLAVEGEDWHYLELCADFWYRWVSAVFLKAYLNTAAPGGFLPQTRAEFQVLLETYLLEKSVYELGYELNNRPDWIKIPLQGIRQLVGRSAG
jgi:maltose alpha-D-glucosyltransferase / alpha-amylase